MTRTTSKTLEVTETAVRPSRAEVLGDLLVQPGYVSTAVLRASASWLPEHGTTHLIADPHLQGLVAAHDLLRRVRFPAAWDVAYRLADDAIEKAVAEDEVFAREVLRRELPAAVEAVLNSVSTLTDHGLATEEVAPHLAAKVLMDAYLDLFEGCLAELSKVYVPLRSTGAPKRVEPDAVARESGRDLFQRLGRGREWRAVLVPFDPFYRNGIAHRSTDIQPDGSVTIRDVDAAEVRHLSWPHLVCLVQDAVAVVNALVAALELTRHRPQLDLPLASLAARERVGFCLLPLRQVLEKWELDPSGMLTIAIRGRRCSEVDLVLELARAFLLIQPSPAGVFIRYLNLNREERGWWWVDWPLLTIAQEASEETEPGLDALEAAVRESESRQLRW